MRRLLITSAFGSDWEEEENNFGQIFEIDFVIMTELSKLILNLDLVSSFSMPFLSLPAAPNASPPYSMRISEKEPSFLIYFSIISLRILFMFNIIGYLITSDLSCCILKLVIIILFLLFVFLAFGMSFILLI